MGARLCVYRVAEPRGTAKTKLMTPPQQKVTKRKVSFGATMRTVLWSFVGIRKSRDYQRDTEQLNPVHVVIAAVIGVLIFIATLIIIVRTVVAH